MSRRGEFAATEKHAGNSYGVKKKDIEAAMGAGMIPVMDFKGEAFKQIKLRSDISSRIVSVTYINIEDAAANLEDRQRSSGETAEDIEKRLKLIKKDQEYIIEIKEAIDDNNEFIRTSKKKDFWNENIKKII